MNLSKIIACLLIVVFICMIAQITTSLATSAISWDHLGLLLEISILGIIYYASIPLVILYIISFYRIPSTILCISITIGWLLLIFFLRAKHPWIYYGHFPWWMFKRDFLQALPISLSFSLAFSIAARKFSNK